MLFFLIPAVLQAEEVNFQIKFPARCMFGDFDAINQDSMHNDDSRILLSLYSLNDPLKESAREIFTEINSPKEIKSAAELEDFKRQTAEIYETLFYSGLKVKLGLPVADNGEVFVLAICNDPQRTNSCQAKEFKSVDQIIKAYTNNQGKFRAEAHLYFYHLIVKTAEGLKYLEGYEEADWHKFSSQSLMKLSAEEVRKQKERLDLILSIPLKSVTADTLEIELPRYDTQKCQSQR